MGVVEQVLSHEINPEIVHTINSLGGKAKGFAGSEFLPAGNFLLPGQEKEQIDIGFVGEVFNVNIEPLRDCIRRSITPVISPTARGEDGKIYNCNADVSAAQTASRLKPGAWFS